MARLPWSTRVDSLTNYYHSEAVEDDLNVERLVDDAGSLSDDDLARIERIALSEISVAGRLVSHDGRVAGLAISFALPENSNTAVTQITDYVRGLLDEARADHPDIAYYLTGDVFVSRVLTEAAQDDMGILAPAAFLVIVSVAAILLRSLLATLAIVVVLISVIGSTGRHRLDRLGAQRRQLRRSDDRHDDGHRRLGPRRRDDHVRYEARSGQGRRCRRIATRQCLAGVPDDGHDDDRIPQPERLGLSAFSDPRQSCGVRHAIRLRVFHDASAGAAVGPAVARASRTRRAFRFLRSLRGLRRGAPHAPALVHAVAVAVATGVPRIELTDNWLQYLDERYEFRRDTDFVVENLTGMENLECSLSAGRAGGITDPDYLRKVDAFAE